MRKFSFVLVVAFSALFAGCSEPQTTSDISGKKVGAQQLVAEAENEARKLVVAAEAKIEAKKQAEAAAKAESERQIATADREAKLALSKLTAQSSITAAEIEAAHEDAVAAVAADYGAKLAGAALDISAIQSQTESAVADLEAKRDAGLRRIEDSRKATLAAWGILKPLVALVPGYGAQIQQVGDQAVQSWAGPGTAALGVTSLAYGIWQRFGRKRAEGVVQTAEAAADKSESIAKSIINHIDVLRAKSPELRELMKRVAAENKTLVDHQLSLEAANMIKSESIT